MPDIEVRAATTDDWPALWPVVEPVLRAGETYTIDPQIDGEGARKIWTETPGARVLLASDPADSTVLGTAKFGPNQGGPGAHVATASFMVGPAARGRGVGRLLGREVLRRAAAAGFTAMQFNAVVETNTAAVNLWRSLGFTIVGTVPGAFLHPKHGPVGLHVMHRSLIDLD